VIAFYYFTPKKCGDFPLEIPAKSPEFQGEIPAIPVENPRDSGGKSPRFRGEIPAITMKIPAIQGGNPVN
jgi:hypothetical protein